MTDPPGRTRKDSISGITASGIITSNTRYKVFQNIVLSELRAAHFDAAAVEQLRKDALPRFRKGSVWSINALAVKRFEENARAPLINLLREWKTTCESHAIIYATGIAVMQMQTAATTVDFDRIRVVQNQKEWSDEMTRLENLPR